MHESIRNFRSVMYRWKAYVYNTFNSVAVKCDFDKIISTRHVTFLESLKSVINSIMNKIIKKCFLGSLSFA